MLLLDGGRRAVEDRRLLVEGGGAKVGADRPGRLAELLGGQRELPLPEAQLVLVNGEAALVCRASEGGFRHF